MGDCYSGDLGGDWREVGVRIYAVFPSHAWVSLGDG